MGAYMCGHMALSWYHCWVLSHPELQVFSYNKCHTDLLKLGIC